MSAPQHPQPGGPTSIDQFRPPRRRVPWWVLLVVLAVLIALVVVGVRISRTPVAEAPASSRQTSTPARAPAAPATPTQVPSSLVHASRMDFTTPDGATGWWSVDRINWTGDGVELTVSIHVEEGVLRDYSLFILENNSAKSHEPRDTGWSDDISQGTVESGRTARGRTFVPCPRADATLVLGTKGGRQPISALVIDA